jgi:hypothetical protein
MGMVNRGHPFFSTRRNTEMLNIIRTEAEPDFLSFVAQTPHRPVWNWGEEAENLEGERPEVVVQVGFCCVVIGMEKVLANPTPLPSVPAVPAVPEGR